MFDFDALSNLLDALGLTDWNAQLVPRLRDRLTGKTHGDWQRWSDIVQALPAARGDTALVRKLLMGLHPWRKGPLTLDDVTIDTEWRSDWKWDRVRDALDPLEGRNVLDVGCGNGYYALRMREAGAACVIGVDPTLLFAMQFLAISVFRQESDVFVLPCRLEETPTADAVFDTTFSMGVLYHQREPLRHLEDVRRTLRAGGQLVLETIHLPGDGLDSLTPKGRYARMRNVWHLPTVPQLVAWVESVGFGKVRVVDTTLTTTDEQRSTAWMTFESLREALDPGDPTRTVEGWPAPRRVVITATK